MSNSNSPFTERSEDGDFTVDIRVWVSKNRASAHYLTPEFDAEFNFDNFVGLNEAEAFSHPALIAKLIEKIIGDGEVKYHFERRSDELAKVVGS